MTEYHVVKNKTGTVSEKIVSMVKKGKGTRAILTMLLKFVPKEHRSSFIWGYYCGILVKAEQTPGIVDTILNHPQIAAIKDNDSDREAETTG